MDLAAFILADHSRAGTDAVADCVGDDPARFGELFALVREGSPRLRQCAVWSLARCVQRQPHLIDPWLEAVVLLLGDQKAHPALRRNFFQILQTAHLPESTHHTIFEAACRALELPSAPAAEKAYGITILKRLTVLYPEMLPTVRQLVAEAASIGSAAVRSRARTEFKL